MSDFLNNRGKSLEDAFFRKQDAKLLGKKKHQIAMREISGLDNDKVLDHLIELGVTPETLEAIALVPLVHVAWADGNMNEHERDAILKATDAKGIERDSESFETLRGWLDQKPNAKLFTTWVEYIRALHDVVEADHLAELATSITAFAEDVAKAAGGFLGLRSISKEEESALAEITAAFSPK